MMITQYKKAALVALVAALALVVIAGVWFLAYEFFNPRAVAEEEQKAGKKEVTVEMEPFIVNLAGHTPARYLRVSLSLALKDSNARQNLKGSNSRIRDGLIMLLTSKTAESLLAADGKSQLRTQIVEQINAAAGDDVVETAYFREFLIQ
ncbi:MAG TPA: flagellar basal body-associated FliL family protein [Candidatus Binatia bacterium]|jgi:flagellar FliL protein